MKVTLFQKPPPGNAPVKWSAGLSLVEMMITMGIFSLVVIAFVYAQMFGMRQDQVVQSKLGASDQSRRGFNQLAQDVRSAKIWQVGNGTVSTFTPIPNGTAQKGNAIQLNLTTNTSIYIQYFFDTTANELRRKHSGDASSTLIAEYLTNTMYFSAEDYRGVMQTNLSHKGVINVLLQFQQYQYPLTKVGAGYLYDYYKMQFKLTPHVPDGQ